MFSRINGTKDSLKKYLNIVGDHRVVMVTGNNDKW